MKTTTKAMLAAAALTLSHGALQAAEMAQTDSQMGLSKTSVYDDPSPDVFQYPPTDPGEAKALPRAYSGAPPQIPHSVDDFLPITAQKNECNGCHNKPARIGKNVAKGTPPPMPESHYHKADTGKLEFSDSRYICVQCHTPQANVKDLVGNTFTPK
ncbi:MAG: cytochrome C [Thiobacillus sp.]|nr:cytochrome C [Thiobacillus sp.]